MHAILHAMLPYLRTPCDNILVYNIAVYTVLWFAKMIIIDTYIHVYNYAKM